MQEWWTASDRERSSSRRSRSAWASTRPTSATSTTTTCRRASSRTRRRSAAPAATATPSICELLRLPGRRADARELRLRRHADARGARGAARRGASRTTSARSSPSPSTSSRARHDVRPLVLKTILTYLELDGLLRQGTPFYAGYRVRPLGDGIARRRLRRASTRRAPRSCAASSRAGKTGRIWTTHRPRRRRPPRSARSASRIVAALGYLEEQGLVELQAGRGAPALHAARAARPRPTRCSTSLVERFERREQAEIDAHRSASSRSSRTTAAR